MSRREGALCSCSRQQTQKKLMSCQFLECKIALFRRNQNTIQQKAAQVSKQSNTFTADLLGPQQFPLILPVYKVICTQRQIAEGSLSLDNCCLFLQWGLIHSTRTMKNNWLSKQQHTTMQCLQARHFATSGRIGLKTFDWWLMAISTGQMNLPFCIRSCLLASPGCL